MPDIERGSFPEITFTEALDIAERIRTKNIRTAAALAGELGFSPTTHGGTLYYKRSALSKHFRILEPSNTVVKFTPLGERLVHPLSESDRGAAVRESLLGIPLLAKLYEALGPTYHPDDFKPKLSQLTGATPSAIAVLAKRYEDVYLDAANHLRKIGEMPTSPPSSGGEPHLDQRKTQRQSGGGIAPVKFNRPVREFNLENHYSIVVALDTDAIEEAVVLLEALKGRVKKTPALSRDASTSDGPAAAGPSS
jgi:hypothetical protein